MRFSARIRPGILTWFSLLLAITFARTAFPAPITFNTALPVADGRGGRVQSKLIRSTRDPGTQDRELTVRAQPLVVAYGAVLTSQTFSRQIDIAVSCRLNTEANDFEFGDETRLDLSWQKRVWPKTLGSGVPAFVYAVLESNLIHNRANRVGGLEDPNSGGTSWFLAPGIQRVTKKTVMEAAVQVPVVQDLDGNSLENDFTAILSFRVNL